MVSQKLYFMLVVVALSLTLTTMLINYDKLYPRYSTQFNHRMLMTKQEDCFSEALAISTCSCRADRRGLRQRVMAFSLYGNLSDPEMRSRYVDPLMITINRVRQVYPGWVIRIYSPLNNNPNDLTNQMLKDNFEVYDHVDLCNATRALESLNLSTEKIFPMVWRFLPLLDPTVDQFMSRDSDGVFLDREIEAVYEWLRSPAIFHVMRDHPWHCVPMMGGLWGAKTYLDRRAISTAALKLVYDQMKPDELVKGVDQDLISWHIWPLAKKNLISHDSYCCASFPKKNIRPFPTRRISTEYVGDILISSNLSSNPLRICPEECRPQEHPDWIYC